MTNLKAERTTFKDFKIFVIIIRFEMCVRGRQIQVKHDIYLALLYLSVSLLSSRETVTLALFNSKC